MMSSFRIDRQYVAFESVEMRSVNADGVSEQCKSITADSSNSGYLEECRHAILEKIQKEAEDKSQLILSGAESKADLILKKARGAASAIIKKSQDEATKILENAKLEGYQQGQKEAAISADARKREEAKELQQMLAGLRTSYDKLVDDAREDIISLVIDITKKIIGVKLKESDEVFIGLINEAIDKLKHAGCITIHVSPEDYARYFGNDAAEDLIDGNNTKIVIIEEGEYASGDLVVESEGEMFDLSICKQLKKVEKVFLDEGQQ